MSDKNVFIRGALLLTIAGVISKLLGSVYTIFLQNMIGDHGLGLYQMAYPVYSTLLILSTAGFPIAVSKFVSEHVAIGDLHGAKKVFRISAGLLMVTGILCFLLLFFGAAWFAKVFGDPEAALAIRAIAPALLVVPFMSAVRGYFQGWQQMEPTAVSQVTEQLIRVATILIAAYLLYPFGNQYAAAGAAFGAVTGALAALLVLMGYVWRKRGLFRYPAVRQAAGSLGTFDMMRKLVYYAIPVSLGALVVPFINNVDVITVVNLLKHAGMDQENATKAFGLLSGRAFKLMLLPSTFATAIAAALLPAISAAMAVGDRLQVQSKMEAAMRFTVLISLPAALGLAILAVPINIMLFKNDLGSQAIVMISMATLLSSVQLTTTAILQGANYVYTPVRNLLIGCLAKLALNVVLVPHMGINGAALATVAAYLVSSVLNLYNVREVTGIRFDLKLLVLRPALSAFFMSAAAYAANRQFFPLFLQYSQSVRLAAAGSACLSIALGVLVYLFSLFVTGSITKNDIESFPRVGSSLVRICSRLGLLR